MKDHMNRKSDCNEFSHVELTNEIKSRILCRKFQAPSPTLKKENPIETVEQLGTTITNTRSCMQKGQKVRPPPTLGGEQSTLSNALMLCMSMAPVNLRMAVLASVRPLWLQALSANPPVHKLLFSNGRLVQKRALPSAVAVPLVEEWIPAAIETIRQEVNELSTSLAAWDQALHGNGDGVELVADYDDEDGL